MPISQNTDVEIRSAQFDFALSYKSKAVRKFPELIPHTKIEIANATKTDCQAGSASAR